MDYTVTLTDRHEYGLTWYAQQRGGVDPATILQEIVAHVTESYARQADEAAWERRRQALVEDESLRALVDTKIEEAEEDAEEGDDHR